MSFNQTRDLLDHARGFHRRLIRFYEDLLDQTREDQTFELIEDLIEHEEVFEKRLLVYEEVVSQNTLDTFFKYMIEDTDQRFGEYETPDKVDTDFVVGAARHFDECLSCFYEEMAKRTLSASTRGILENLMEMEQREQLVLSKMMLDLKVA